MTSGAGELLALAADLAVAAGRMVAEGRSRSGVGVLDTKSTSTDVVTEFDRASERLVVDGILARRPHDGIVGEEGTDRTGTSGVTWLVDPIDGTTNFLYGLAGYGVSIAACDGDSTVAGAVYLPATDELFSATRGGGAALDGAPIRCSATADLGQALVATGFSYRPERRAEQGRRIAALLPAVRDLRRFGAAAPDLCYVACGRVDAYFEEWLNPWDLAAGELIAREAGCRTGDLSGGAVRPESVLAANPAVFAPLLDLLARIDGAPLPR